MIHKELLIEWLVEEMPARLQKGVACFLQDTAKKELAALSLSCETATVLTTPRRICLSGIGVPDSINYEKTERGPRVDAPPQALEGFLRKFQASQHDLTKENGYYVFYKKIQQKTIDLIPSFTQALTEKMAGYFPKTMRWGEGEWAFVRPLHQIAGTWGGQKIKGQVVLKQQKFPFQESTVGHRFMAPGPVPLKTLDTYKTDLNHHYVMVSSHERRQAIDKSLQKIEQEKSIQAIRDEALLEEIEGLVEWPITLLGTIDSEFMDLPDEILITTMQHHQKYIAFRTPKGALAPYFAVVANIKAKDGGKKIIEGNQRVLKARLSDARFFWDQDKKTSLGNRVKDLDKIIFHTKLGTVAHKIERIRKIAGALQAVLHLANPATVMRAIDLCKTDLITHLVGEFPELQGVIGYHLTLYEGMEKDIAEAIRDHYAPQGPDDKCPTNPISVVVALADKLDTIVQFFRIGEKPTSSKDPYALRRTTYGIIRIILENDLDLKLGDIINKILDTDQDGKIQDELSNYFRERLRVYYRDQGIRYDITKAVLDSSDLSEPMVRTDRKLKAMMFFLDTKEGQDLLTVYKRAHNILVIEQKKDKAVYNGQKLHRDLLQHETEIALHQQIEMLKDDMASCMEKHEYDKAMQAIAKTRPVLDRFFDDITVNDPKPELRVNRLELLGALESQLHKIAYFEAIEG